jgi:hypothetical protein
MNNTLNALAVAGAFLTSVSAHAITLSLIPASSSVTVGTPVDLQLRISGLGDGTAPSLGAYDFTLGFDPSILGFSPFSFGDPVLGDQLDFLGSGTVTLFDGATPGQLTVFELSMASVADLDSLQAPEFALATVSFNTLAIGTSGLEFLSSAFTDSVGGPLQVELGRGSVEVTDSGTPVPEGGNPAVLLALGLLSFVAGSRTGWRLFHRCRI